ncbi:MAG: hypothetical protein NTX35_16560 [Verrucomicrobia bacterium]|nr:hypothetical protein [Verrucomicrobiota bacterium]
MILAVIMCSSCATTAKRQEAALKTMGASRMYGDAIRFGVMATGRPPPNGVRFGESVIDVSLNSQRKLKDTDLRALADLSSLQKLELDHTNITDHSTVFLKNCPNLRVLGLQQVKITDASLPHIAKLTQLRELDLWGSLVTSNGLRSLVTLRHIEKLWLHDTSIGDDAVPILASFKSLKVVGLGDAKVSPGGKRELRRLRPDITIYPDDFKPSQTSDAILPPTG